MVFDEELIHQLIEGRPNGRFYYPRGIAKTWNLKMINENLQIDDEFVLLRGYLTGVEIEATPKNISIYEVYRHVCKLAFKYAGQTVLTNTPDIKAVYYEGMAKSLELILVHDVKHVISIIDDQSSDVN